MATISDVVSTIDFNGLLGMALHPNFSTDNSVNADKITEITKG